MANVVSVGHISASTADDFQTCERLYKFKHILGYEVPSSQAQVFGTVLDFAFDKYYETRSVEAMKQIVEEKWPGDVTEELCEKGRTKARALKICGEYAARWQHDGVEVILPAQRENQFVNIPGTNYRLAFRLDKLIRWDRTLRIMEHKTTSQLTNNTLNRYNPNIQNRLYTWAVRQMQLPVPGLVAGMLMDVVCVNVQKLDFKRDVISQSERTDAEVVTYLQRIVKDIEARTAQDDFQPNWSQCNTFGECDFRRICKMSPEYYDSILQTYQRRVGQ
jgi:hypothetical protein